MLNYVLFEFHLLDPPGAAVMRTAATGRLRISAATTPRLRANSAMGESPEGKREPVFPVMQSGPRHHDMYYVIVLPRPFG
jgi:hypothetical protein